MALCTQCSKTNMKDSTAAWIGVTIGMLFVGGLMLGGRALAQPVTTPVEPVELTTHFTFECPAGLTIRPDPREGSTSLIVECADYVPRPVNVNLVEDATSPDGPTDDD